jgi:hypothetical protein
MHLDSLGTKIVENTKRLFLAVGGPDPYEQNRAIRPLVSRAIVAIASQGIGDQHPNARTDSAANQGGDNGPNIEASQATTKIAPTIAARPPTTAMHRQTTMRAEPSRLAMSCVITHALRTARKNLAAPPVPPGWEETPKVLGKHPRPRQEVCLKKTRETLMVVNNGSTFSMRGIAPRGDSQYSALYLCRNENVAGNDGSRAPEDKTT